jgi:hypothetical protein
MANTRVSPLQEELELLEAETFEIQDYTELTGDDLMASTTSCCSTCSSCTSSSGTSCCG